MIISYRRKTNYSLHSSSRSKALDSYYKALAHTPFSKNALKLLGALNNNYLKADDDEVIIIMLFDSKQLNRYFIISNSIFTKNSST